jgi:hypothetical protein
MHFKTPEYTRSDERAIERIKTSDSRRMESYCVKQNLKRRG